MQRRQSVLVPPVDVDIVCRQQQTRTLEGRPSDVRTIIAQYVEWGPALGCIRGKLKKGRGGGVGGIGTER